MFKSNNKKWSKLIENEYFEEPGYMGEFQQKDLPKLNNSNLVKD